MEFCDEKRRLIEALINQRVPEKQFMEFAHEQGTAVPPELLKKWRKRFYAKRTIEFPSTPRLINRFRIGADPEFHFVQVHPDYANGRYIHAQKLGLNTLDAFGCDLTGRQAELRAHPSRFVLEVVASLLETLRWMNEALRVAHYRWKASAFVENDGCGGHVHFGRKRPDVPDSIQSLNHLTNLFMRTNIFDYAGQKLRQKVTKYGKLSDVRAQSHGFEFRSMPTWLDSPWTAYLTLVLSKLCVFHKLDLRNSRGVTDLDLTLIQNFLRAYQSVDDDARIALITLENLGLPTFVDDDFRGAWGIGKPRLNIVPAQTFFPPTIAPSKSTVLELFEHFTRPKSPMTNLAPVPTWTPYKLPEGVFKITIPPHYSGLSEIAQGLLSIGTPVIFSNGALNDDIQVFCDPMLNIQKNAIVAAMKRRGCKVSCQLVKQDADFRQLTIAMPVRIHREYVVNKDMVREIRWLLVDSGLFPICRYDKLDMHKYENFIAEKKKDCAPPIGRLVAQINGQGGVE
jgi:hypothetical protein